MTVQTEDDYEDLLGLWSDLESGLGIVLGNPDSIQEFEPRVWQYDRWMQALLKRDTDVALYLLFQLATNSPVGYSASHALVCAVLCHLIAADLKLPPTERDSLVHAALTMNMAMTAMQDELAGQVEKPSHAQRNVIGTHAASADLMLGARGVVDALWRHIIRRHHDESTDLGALQDLSPVNRLVRILRVIDRYAAMISPRKNREGRTATDSARALLSNAIAQSDEVGQALIRTVGLCPPGTYVALDNHEIAVVTRRSQTLNQPFVVIVINEVGALLNPPRLHPTTQGQPAIQNSLAASAIHERLNHHLILQLGVNAARQIEGQLPESAKAGAISHRV